MCINVPEEVEEEEEEEKEEEEGEKEGLLTSNDHQSVGTTRFRVALPPNPPTC